MSGLTMKLRDHTTNPQISVHVRWDIDQAADRIDALEATVEALEQFQLERQSAEYLDAERYRYLRDRADDHEDGPIICSGLGDNFDFLRGPECDEEIDAAMRSA